MGPRGLFSVANQSKKCSKVDFKLFFKITAKKMYADLKLLKILLRMAKSIGHTVLGEEGESIFKTPGIQIAHDARKCPRIIGLSKN